MNRFMVLVLPKHTHEMNEVTGKMHRTKARRVFFDSRIEAKVFAHNQTGRRHIVDRTLRMTLEKMT